tara:strand:+ start:108 stop:428 length:321 start_codon:yes stop_codon:yes gene_type:complete
MKIRGKKVAFQIIDHWTNTMHMIERPLNVSMKVEEKGVSFYAYQHKVDEVVEEIKTNPNVIERFNLIPPFDIGPPPPEVDVSLLCILIAWHDRVVGVEPVERRGSE